MIKNDLIKWQFPAISIAADDYLVVFASKKDRRVVNSSPGVRYIRLMKSGNNPGGNVINLAEVEVIDSSGINRARNASVSLSSTYGSRFYASACVDGLRAGNGLSNQGMCSTGQSSTNEWWQVDLGGLYDIRQIRIYNRDDCCQDRLSNVYVLAADTAFGSASNLNGARNNADYEFKVGAVSASNPDRVFSLAGNNVSTLHTNFKLSAGGEYLGLIQPDGQTIADEYAPEFPQQYKDISFNHNKYYDIPTPGRQNNAGFEGVIEEQVAFSLDHGFYDSTQSLALSTTVANAVIRYTLDGSVPTAQRGLVYAQSNLY